MISQAVSVEVRRFHIILSIQIRIKFKFVYVIKEKYWERWFGWHPENLSYHYTFSGIPILPNWESKELSLATTRSHSQIPSEDKTIFSTPQSPHWLEAKAASYPIVSGIPSSVAKRQRHPDHSPQQSIEAILRAFTTTLRRSFRSSYRLG